MKRSFAQFSNKAFCSPLQRQASTSSTTTGHSRYENLERTAQSSKVCSQQTAIDLLLECEVETDESSKSCATNHHGNSPKLFSGSHDVVLQSTSESQLSVSIGESTSTTGQRWFSVLYCKHSARKHKKWEGDAILMTEGRFAKLFAVDEDRLLAQGSGYQIKEIAALESGGKFIIGDKELEIQAEIPGCPQVLAKNSSGKIDESSTSQRNTTESVAITPKPVSSASARKAFVNPCLDSAVHCASGSTKRTVGLPLYGKNENTFYLPRPSLDHSLKYNTLKLDIHDVTIDPHLLRHLRPHQRDGVVFMYECVLGMKEAPIRNSYNSCLSYAEEVEHVSDHSTSMMGAILADEMGLGKSLQTIALLWTLLKQGPYGGRPIIRKAIVVCPSSLVLNWVAEFKKWLGDERLRPTSDVLTFATSNLVPVLIISYDMIIRSIDKLTNVQIDIMVCDEGHRLKNDNIKANCLLSGLPVKRRVLLTGTPIQNCLSEFFSLCNFVNPNCLGSASAFRKYFENVINNVQLSSVSDEDKELGVARSTDLTDITSHFILRRTQKVISQYLPVRVDYVVFCVPSRLQLKLYRAVVNSREVRKLQSSSSKMLPLACIDVLRKICSHPVLLLQSIHNEILSTADDAASIDESGADAEQCLREELKQCFPAKMVDEVQIEDSGKLKVLYNLLRSVKSTSHDKFVVVSGYTQTLNLIEQLCAASDFQTLRLDGATSTAQRQKIVDQFNSARDNSFVFLLSLKAGGVGLNLIGSNRLVLYDPDWNPANDLQALARVWRDGQRRVVHLYRLLTTGSIEEKIYQRQIKKVGLTGILHENDQGHSVLELPTTSQRRKRAKTEGFSSFTPEEIKDLFTLHEDCYNHCQTHQLISCECQQQEIRSSTAKDGVNNEDISMAELLKWEHASGSFPAEWLDHGLDSAEGGISMVFRNLASTV